MLILLKKSYISLIVFIILSLFSLPLNSQTINTKFGKNRVQFHNDFNNWWKYETDYYSIYWYSKELNLAKSVILLSQISYVDIQDILDFKMNKKINLIIYSDLEDYNQTNFGIKDKLINDKFITPSVSDNKIILYFNGDHNHLLQQIREGTAKIFIKNMFDEISFNNIYKKIVNNKIPQWFLEGAPSYLAQNWDIKSDNTLRNIFTANSIDNINFDRLNTRLPKLIGKSFFYFLEQNYSKKDISDLFYLIRINRNINSSISNVTGYSLNNLSNQWLKYFSKVYKEDNKVILNDTINGDLNLSYNNKNIIYPNIRINYTNKYLAYTSNQKGKKKINIVDIINSNSEKVLSQGYINTEQLSNNNYPFINFYPSSNALAIIYKKKDFSILKIVDSDTKETKYEKALPTKLKSIISFDIWDDDNLIISAIVNGRIDLFKYNIKKRQSQEITHDFWNELDISVNIFNGKRGVFFVSNRIDSVLENKTIDTILLNTKFDVFFLDLESKETTRITNTPKDNERNPIIINQNILFLTDEKGVYLIKSLNLKTGKSKYFSTNTKNVYSFYPSSKNIAISQNNLCSNSMRLRPYRIDSMLTIAPTSYYRKKYNSRDTIKNILKKIEIDKGLLFQSRYKVNTKSSYKGSNINSEDKSSIKLKRYISSHAIASRLKFSFSDLITKIDNEPLFDGMSIYSNENNTYTPPKMGLLTKIYIKDMFEDYFIESGFRFSPDFKEKEYFTVFDNLKHQIDWQYVYYRKTKSNYKLVRQNIIDKYSDNSNLFRVKAKYPFDVYQSISLATNLRINKYTLLASDTLSLNERSSTEQRISLKLEYIFDNTSQTSVNSFEGNRSKAFIEVYNKFNLNPYNIKEIDLSKGFMTVIGFDFRQYHRVLRKSTFAFRAVGQTSFGSESNLYFLGGVENWQFSKQATDANIQLKNEKIAYKILAANLRGFGYNAKNGASFALLSSELRIPIFRYLYNPKKSFFNDFQVTCFFDVGLTWNGFSPFSQNNKSNIRYIDVPPTIKLKVKYYSDPLLAGYGFGIRSTLFGYFVKLDYAWGIDTKIIQKPMLYLSLGYDF